MTETQSRVMLVDDNLTNLQVLYQALEAEGYQLLVAQSGEQALEISREARPQLILLDINMPGIDGFETARRLKEEQTCNAKVIFLSARGDIRDKLEGFDTGAVDYIEKPFQFEEVVARVRAHLATYHRQRELERAAVAAPPSFREFSADELQDLIAAGEDDRIEFKSTLRCNLHTGKNDKRIENACLKTIAAFLNSEGGLLLVGVNDAGEILGLEADGFRDRDLTLRHLTGLVRDYLGGGVAAFVRMSLHEIGGREVLATECLPSPQPVYFRREQQEHFYVRSGPSTLDLSPSEVVNYVASRGG